MIKVSSQVTRPVCPRCNTAHTFIKCGKPNCATLMCLPENVNQFSCPRCGVQLARPGFAQTKGPTVVRCGNTTCGFLLSVSTGVTRFSCPKCNVVQLLPGTEEASKRKAALEEEKRQEEIKRREAIILQELCEMFGRFGIEPVVVEAVYDDCNHERFSSSVRETHYLFSVTFSLFLSRPQTVVSLTGMLQDRKQIEEALSDATYMQELELHHKRSVIERSILCPLSHEVRKLPWRNWPV